MGLYILSIIALAFTVGCIIGGSIIILIHQKKIYKLKVELFYNLLPEELKTKEEDGNEND